MISHIFTLSGQMLTICVSSQEEHACLQHPAGCLSSHTLPAQYLYYSVQGWDRQKLYAPCKPVTEVMPVAPPDLQEAPTEARQGTCSVSPTLDVSIEDLNRLILEIDPTFQPLQLKPAHTQSPVQTIPPSDPAVPQKKEADSPDIKYIEMSPARAKGAESWQNPAGSSSTSLSVSPRLLPCGGTPRNTCDMGGPMAFVHAHDLGGLPATGRQPPMCTQVSESISIPQRGQKNSAAHGSDSHLASSPGFENFLKLAHHGRLAQRCSEASMLSTSPGSDTSYVLGSSTQSLSSGVPDTPPTRSTGSLSSVGSLNGSYDGICSSSSYHPSVLCSQKGNSSLPQPPQKGQTHNGSPPVANSSPQIPIVLINGRLEDSEAFSRPPQVHPSSFRHKIPQPNSGVFSGAGGSNKTSSESWSKDTQPTMKFVMDTSKYWFKPTITRDEAVQLLTDKLPGTFIMRDSTSYRGSFGLAMKQHPPAMNNSRDSDGGDHIRHFLIESSARGVHLKGADEEPYFGSLSAFVYQHTIMPLALPCKLVIPSQELESAAASHRWSPFLPILPACNLLFLHSMTMETLTGKAAIQKAVSSAFELEVLPTPTIVHFKVTEQGITLTDIQRKVFFRRHYPLATISFCEMDPENRKWQKFSRTSRIFGVVAKSPADSENVCHLFAEYDAVHPASHVVDFIKKLLPAA
uniref:Tensin 4 n=1 Tax=Varanus komodoensis TaxID=61221 RepID=A0A8D2Q533_VARKO